MSILIFALIVVIVVALLIWAVDQIPLPSPLNMIVRVVVILVGALLIINRIS
jgi:hypothetical protein